MPKKHSKPSYLLHKPTGQARVRIDGKDHYLGEYGSPDSRQKYDDLIAEWFIKQGDVSGFTLNVSELSLLFMEYAAGYYQKNDKPTCEVNNIRVALRPLIRLFGNIAVREFSPLKLKAVRNEMIKAGCVRTSINRQIGRIKRMFRWGVENEYVTSEVYTALTAVAGLKFGRSVAKESDPVKPVPQEMIDAIKPFVSRQVWAMIQLQILTGMRPGEVLQMRGRDMKMSSKVWEYEPESHKTQHHGKKRIIFFGIKGKAILQQFLKADPDAYLFSPADATEERHALRRAKRKSTMTPSQNKRKKKINPKRSPKNRYSDCSYRQAIAKACEKAFNMPLELQNPSRELTECERDKIKSEAKKWRKKYLWHPHQLRHNTATELRKKFGTEAARTVLGLSSTAITEVYAEKDFNTAQEIMEKVG